MQKAIFPMEYVRKTCGAGQGQHIGSLAEDYAGRNTGKCNVYAPCDIVITRIRLNANGEIYWQSIEPVETANGNISYICGVFIHCDNRHLKKGMIFKQHEYITQEGGWGNNGKPNAFGNHLHIEVYQGKGQINQIKNKFNCWQIPKQSKIQDTFFLMDTQKGEGDLTQWKRTSSNPCDNCIYNKKGNK